MVKRCPSTVQTPMPNLSGSTPLELRNVVGDRTCVVCADTVGHLLKLAFEQGEVGNDEIAAQGPGDQPPAGLADGGERLDREPAPS
jgi:hypothetical protein